MPSHPEVWREGVYEDKAGQVDDSVVAVLEKVTSLDDKEEVARLVGEAKGRKGFLFPIYSILCSLLCPAQCTYKQVSRKVNVTTPPFYSDHSVFLGEVHQNFGEIRGVVTIVEALKAALRGEAAPQTEKTKLLQQIVLMIMNLENPDQAVKVSTQANIPLLGFETPNEVLSYLDAVIRSGTSADQKSGTVFLMGNTAHCLLNCTEFYFRTKSQKTSTG